MTNGRFTDGSAARAARAKEIQATLWARHLALKARMAEPMAEPTVVAAAKEAKAPVAKAKKAAQVVHQGADARSALRVALNLGCVVRPMPATDDAMVTHPNYDGAVMVKVTRRDATRELVAMLRRVDKGRYAKVA